MALIRVAGLDLAFANTGLVLANVDTEAGTFHDIQLHLFTSSAENKKQVRKNSDDRRRAGELHDFIQSYCADRHIMFAEIPVGSQNARAAWSLGIAIGVVARTPCPLVEVSPAEVKLVLGKKSASKAEMIAWAHYNHPAAPWLRDREGKLLNSNEHLADALAAIYAGMQTADYRLACTFAAFKKTISRRPV